MLHVGSSLKAHSHVVVILADSKRYLIENDPVSSERGSLLANVISFSLRGSCLSTWSMDLKKREGGNSL